MYPLKRSFSTLILLFLCVSGIPVYASHIVGGELSYKYDGDAVVGGVVKHKYQVTLSLFVDCATGQPEAIAQDNPAFIAIFDGAGNTVIVDTALYATSVALMPAKQDGACGPIYNLPNTCMQKREYVKAYYLADNASGYTIAYQRCCRNSTIMNIKSPGDNGATYFCTIPGSVVNTSATFKNYPPQINCINQPFHFDHSAVDADGDSLSYTFITALEGGSDANIKPIPGPPPYTPITYLDPYSFSDPLEASPAMKIDEVTGLFTGTPTKLGRFLISVCCKEWRGGVVVNMAIREFQMIISDCRVEASVGYKPYAGEDKTILVGQTVHFNALANNYEWSPTTYLNDPHIGDPVGTFPTAGVYSYVLTSVSDSGCVGRDTVVIQVLDHSVFVVPNAFSPNGDHLNDVLKPLSVVGAKLERFRVFNRKGQMVYEGGLSSAGWDGTFNGVMQDIGTYYWELYYYDDKKLLRFMKGDVTLVQ